MDVPELEVFKKCLSSHLLGMRNEDSCTGQRVGLDDL